VLPGAQKLERIDRCSWWARAKPGSADEQLRLARPGILNLAKSPYAKLRSVPVHAVMIEAGFGRHGRDEREAAFLRWADLLEVNGRMDNFRRLTGKSMAATARSVYSDSDIYKWIEAADSRCNQNERRNCARWWTKIFRDIVARSRPTATWNTYYVLEHAAQRMEPKTQQRWHELYNIGHLCRELSLTTGRLGPYVAGRGATFCERILVGPNFGPGADKRRCFRASGNGAGAD